VSESLRLRDYQVQALKDMHARKGRVLLAHEMGLGKTPTSLSMLRVLATTTRVLILAPKTAIPVWERETAAWLAGTPMTVYRGTPKQRAAIWDHYVATGGVLATNYSFIGELVEKHVAFETIIVDESHMLRNRKTAMFKALKKLKSTYFLALTGSPVVNGVGDLWTQLHLLDPKTFSSYWRFVNQFCVVTVDEFGTHVGGVRDAGGLQRALAPYMLRKTKQEVLTELPPKIRQIVPVPLTPRQRALYDDLADDLMATIGADDSVLLVPNVIAKITRLRQIVVTPALVGDANESAMFETLREQVESEYAAGRSVLVFTPFAQALPFIEAVLGDLGRVWTLQGGLSSAVMGERVAAFQAKAQANKALLCTTGVGSSFTATAASTVFFLGSAWSPAHNIQCEDRCILGGQKIFTTLGWKPVEKVGIGDRVIGQDGRPHTVVDVWSRQASGLYKSRNMSIVEIGVRGWYEPLRTTSDHRYLTTQGWVEAGNLRPGDEIVMPSGYEGLEEASHVFPETCRFSSTFATDAIAERVGGRPKKEAVQRNGRLSRAPAMVPMTSEAMFVFGYYLGDGFASIAAGKGRFVSFAGNQQSKADALLRCAEWEGFSESSVTVYTKPPSLGVELRVYSAEWAAWFATELGRTLSTKCIPEWVFAANIPQRRAFLAGLMASDGYARKAMPGAQRYEFVTAKERMAADVTRLMWSLSLKPCITIGSKEQFSVAYTDGITPKLKVGTVTFRAPKHGERVYDLTVDGGESFVIGTAVVHNCHRYGQQDTVLVKYLVGENTIDEHVLDILNEKSTYAALALRPDMLLRPRAAQRVAFAEAM
jgi:intein/homing endonuclease